MPKMKVHKGLKKRVRVTAKGKVRYKPSFGNHLMSSKSGDRCRRLRRPRILGSVTCKRIKIALGVGGA
ncbi:MAG TPA: 50S ribosomal protein L35 [Phycisphaerae bacterium]|nr:50S ribosomal protein L35 [Phycisphaerae bacterium]HNU46715.1 50S ribosomal protein L35 [Phycisphaerae bacterium]